MKLTPTQIAKARYDEATQILEAWNQRLARAQADYYKHRAHHEDALTTKRILNATQLQHTDAQTQALIAQQTWINTANQDLYPTRQGRAA